MKVKVVDSVPGSGKTEAAIAFMRSHPERRYLFVTPFLAEIQRIKKSCPELYFEEPADSSLYKTKLDSLHNLLETGANVASTHALFAYYSDETRRLLEAGGYTLILDEVMNVIERENIKMHDFEMMFQSGFVEMEEDGLHVRWVKDDYVGVHQSLMKKAQLHNLFFFENRLLFWSVPVHSFQSFREVFVLTYMFEAQMQCYYYQMYGLEFEYWGVRHTDAGYEFSREATVPEYARQLINKVHILEDPKANEIGRAQSALSANWYRLDRKNHDGLHVKAMGRMVYNVLHNRFNAAGSDCIWTTYKDHLKIFHVNGYKKSYVTCTARATNAYRDRHYLAYCVNLYFHPLMKRYFQSEGVQVHEDRYALSEMIQWVWRSAIRCGEEIWIYVPSSRMRGLLKGWLEELANAP